MRLQRKSIIVGVIVLSVALVGGCGAYIRHRFYHRDISKHVLKRWDRHVAKLDLSEAQREGYEEIRQKVQASLREARYGREELFQELRSEIDRENPDLNRMVDLVKERVEAMPSLANENLDRFVEFYNLLDDDQQAQVIEMIRKRMKRRGY